VQLCEKYRPRDWEQFIGNEKAIRRVRFTIGAPGFGDGGGDVFWISGDSSTGKTSLALLMARELGATNWADCVQINGKRFAARDVDELQGWLHLCANGDSGWKVAIVDEAHCITDGAAETLLVLLEHLPSKRLVIFTSTCELAGNLLGPAKTVTDPYRSRCKCVKLTNQGLCKPLAAWLKQGATDAGLDGKPVERYERLMKKHGNNIRACWQEIQQGWGLEDDDAAIDAGEMVTA